MANFLSERRLNVRSFQSQNYSDRELFGISSQIRNHVICKAETAGQIIVLPVWHLVLVGILGVVVEVDGVNNAQVEEQLIQDLD